jgi:hypothetical protein
MLRLMNGILAIHGDLPLYLAFPHMEAVGNGNIPLATHEMNYD